LSIQYTVLLSVVLIRMRQILQSHIVAVEAPLIVLVKRSIYSTLCLKMTPLRCMNMHSVIYANIGLNVYLFSSLDTYIKSCHTWQK
jgi:hypothetical protein